MFSKHLKSAPNKAKIKRKHVTLTIQQKLEIVNRLEKGENKNIIMNEFNIGSSTIYDIKKQKEQLKQFLAQSDTSKSIESRQTLKKPKLDELDRVLYKWFSIKRSEGKPITGPMVIEKAKQFHRDLNLPENECVFSDGWLRNFKIRHGIRKLDISGEQKSADEVAANEYKKTFDNIVTQHNLSAGQIYNADETGLLWRCLPNSTLAGGDEKCAKGFKMNKDRLTVLFCSNASGDHKLKPFVIGKYKKPRAFKGLTHLPVIYEAQSNAWMNAELFKNWFFKHFVPDVENNFQKLGLPTDSKAILLLDNCRAHPPASELISGNISVIYLPPNVTSLIQPMDQGVIQNFKCGYRGSFVQSLLNSDCSVKDFQATFNIKDAIYATALAWTHVKEITLQRAWRKLWPNVMAEECNDEDDNLELATSVPNHAELLKAIQDVPSNNPINLSEDELIQWIDADTDEPVVEVFTDDAILQSVINPEKAKEEESDEEEGTAPHVTWQEAADSLNTLIKFAEYNNFYNAAEIMNLHVLRNEFQRKRSLSRKQTDIRELFKRTQSKITPAAVSSFHL